MFARRTAWNLGKNRFTLACEDYRQSGREWLDLTASNPTRVGLIPDERLLQALAKPQALDYDPQPRGLLAARETVADYYRGLGAQLDPSQVILTTSTSEAYSFILRLLCNPDDEVLVPSPSYPLFEFLAGIQDVRLQPYELVYDHGWQIDFHSLVRAITPRSRAVILVNPNNPTGSYVNSREQSELNRLCHEHNLALVADEVFFDFNLTAEKFQSFSDYRDVLTFTLSGLSKVAGLPQMKVAWLAATGPNELVDAALDRLEVIADTYLSMNAPIQHAVPELLAQRVPFQQKLTARLHSNLAELDRQLSAQSLCSRLEVQGGWYATLRVPVTRSDEELAIELLEKKDVLVHPGHFFDFHSEGYLVLSLMTPEPVLAEGVKRVLAYFGD